jgi:hypothetical protein
VITSPSVTENTGKSGLQVNILIMEEKKDTKTQANIDIPVYGPIKVTGNFVLKDIKKGTEEVLKEVLLCSCGRSGNKPFCDDSHKR